MEVTASRNGAHIIGFGRRRSLRCRRGGRGADRLLRRRSRAPLVPAAGDHRVRRGVQRQRDRRARRSSHLAKTVKATSSAPTVHLSGTLTSVPVPAETSVSGGSGGVGSADGSGSSSSSGSGDASASATASAIATAPGTFKLDMVFTQFGAVGDITTGSATSRLLRVEDEVWTAEPSSFWAAAGAVDGGKAYGGLYVKIPSADPRYAGFSDDTHIGFLLDHLLQTSTAWTKGAAGAVGGTPAIELRGTGRGGHRASIWVATDGEPYILRIAPTGGSYQGHIDFTDYGDRYAIQAPLPGQVLDNALLVLPSLSPSPLQSSQQPSSPNSSESPVVRRPSPCRRRRHRARASRGPARRARRPRRRVRHRPRPPRRHRRPSTRATAQGTERRYSEDPDGGEIQRERVVAGEGGTGAGAGRGAVAGRAPRRARPAAGCGRPPSSRPNAPAAPRRRARSAASRAARAPRRPSSALPGTTCPARPGQDTSRPPLSFGTHRTRTVIPSARPGSSCSPPPTTM